ncbi:cation diffusion facilitator CzcD-associated flavoprotein CzcO [Branchiibius hedensis]|uniref:Predicted flavoprotein CzcO associated with the cation diffusion facilitator CzcD n=1 Tax=Branchiibius hedensis TaxID=672460 RepID=A0A2Y8ZTT1_9MICO|nr:NAD(P)/FAD-dependent oxidoreductase [Branchiibius hedensis]PWJ24863.1 cation diffusion facilitator CzcD-associated flavoprotein CzcO [Branchiibius hedensis]SSA33679.1 Predicted flavoprotein CzcO associated with the cation diffusion facilitator CzcD [Branchiibius hedensis]
MNTTGHEANTYELDALIVGAGFGGIYSLYKLRNELGLNVQTIDRAAGVGGTWFWNQYPGALSDSESHVYQYSFDRDLYNDTNWGTKFVTQPEILAYLNGVVDRYDLRKDIRLETSMTSATFDDRAGTWTVATDKGDTIICRFLITGLGLLSAINKPDFPGADDFKGEIVHTGAWPTDLDLTGKRVGVIGNGSTGGQVITAVAKVAGHLTSFQRTPQYSVPAGNRAWTAEELQAQKDNFEENWNQVKTSSVAMGFVESEVEMFSVSAEERERIFEAAWQNGGGFRFMFETFCDIATNPEANEEAAKFIRRKIGEIVHDPETARKLTPTDLYARRPLCDSGLYETFNQPNVSLVSIKENPIVELTEAGVKTADGVIHELDVLICATGFDAVDGNYKRIDIRGRNNELLRDHWVDGPTSYLGMATSGFPNMFMILGPNGPFTNLPPSIETQVEWIAGAIGYLAPKSGAWLEVRPETESEWTDICADIADQTLFPKAASWIFGANIPGKKRTVMFYLGGIAAYREILDSEAAEGYPGFVSHVSEPALV